MSLDYLDTLKLWLDTQDPRLVAYAREILRQSAWLLVLTVVLVPLERLFALRPKKIFRKAIVTDVGYYFLNSLVPGFLLSFPLALLTSFSHRLLPAGFVSFVVGMPLWARLPLGMLVGETGYYWGHRWSHEIPLLWRFHAVHHSAEQMDYLVSTRAHPLDMVFTRMCEFTPMYMLGLASPMSFQGNLVPILVTVIGTFWGYFIHSNVRWRFGPLEWLISTPAFHHWHHTNDGPEYINKNYSPVLPCVDWMFGTFYLPKDKRPERYGIDESISPIMFGQLTDPFLVRRKPNPPATGAPSTDRAQSPGAAVVPPTTDSENLLLSKTDA